MTKKKAFIGACDGCRGEDLKVVDYSSSECTHWYCDFCANYPGMAGSLEGHESVVAVAHLYRMLKKSRRHS